jgi:hypothetical protein
LRLRFAQADKTVMRDLKELSGEDSRDRRSVDGRYRDRVRIRFHLAVALVLFAAPLIGAQDSSFWSFLRAGRVVTRCAESTPAYEQAKARLERLDKRIQVLKNADTPASEAGELRDLLKTECFLPAVETDRIPKPDTALSLREWWTTGGGDWLESFLELPRLGPFDSLKSHVVVQADARKTLDLDAHRQHPLSTLLCPLVDSACGAETRGWRLRADAYLEAHRALGSNSGPTDAEPHKRGPGEISQQCADKVSSTQTGQRYQEWRDCIEMARPKRVALPLGEFKTPTTGWVVVTGRRGHYDFCDTTRAYNLATGAAFIHDSCSALALKPGGDVDVGATNKSRVESVKVGSIQPDNLREAVWMMLFRGEAEELQLKAEYYPLPMGLIPQVTVRTREYDSSSSGMWANTGQTSLTWRWVPTTGTGFVGDLTWPSSYDAAESHAASLLAVAEEGFVEKRCTEKRFPAASSFTPAKDRNPNEVAADALREHDRDSKRASDKWRVLPVCSSPAR